jgi:hypothetical protein
MHGVNIAIRPPKDVPLTAAEAATGAAKSEIERIEEKIELRIPISILYCREWNPADTYRVDSSL